MNFEQPDGELEGEQEEFEHSGESVEEGEFNPETHIDQFIEEQEAEACSTARNTKAALLVVGVAGACAGALLAVWGFMKNDLQQVTIGAGGVAGSMVLMQKVLGGQRETEQSEE